ncbi:hypothetical protein KALB_5376 [Kutzneria albida DSM 43870]|uniref:Peptidase S53 domain-containing protein n=2 Tax=Kutzneria TaxID=43356 RepID=W5WC54_9PSEU|nr:hypothetical protein KALB_5376 [Kutzneria albida DSM 43870]
MRIPGPARGLFVGSMLLATVLTPAAAAQPLAAPAPSAVRAVCAGMDRIPGKVACRQLLRTDLPTHLGLTAAAPYGYGPADLQAAYKAPIQQGAGTTVAVTIGADYPDAEADLAVYRKQYGLPPCTSADGCFRKVNKNLNPSPLPAPDGAWSSEAAMDIQLVSALCPRCRIVLAEADSSDSTVLLPMVARLAKQVTPFVSSSWGGTEYPEQVREGKVLDIPGAVLGFASGDGPASVLHPSSSPYTIAVGGTALVRDPSTARGWSEKAWNSTGYGCSIYSAKPAFQNGVNTGCGKRATADVAAVADLYPGVAYYWGAGGGWRVSGGTSASTPIVVSLWALAGAPGKADRPASYLYAHPGAFNDVTEGPGAHAGWDGPTGLGTPDGVAGFVPVH